MRNAWLFDDKSSTWTPLADMHGGRWYPTVVTLADGRVLAMAGHPSEGDNFRHINNAETKVAIASLIESRGFVCPQLCSPEELGGTDND